MAKVRIVGEKIIWFDFAGEPQEYIVTEASIGDQIEKVIYPRDTGECIEMRVIWKSPISNADSYAYVHTSTGVLFGFAQQFVT